MYMYTVDINPIHKSRSCRDIHSVIISLVHRTLNMSEIFWSLNN